MAQVLDLRGRQLVRDRTPVLLDPSGGRARVLAWTGRAVAVVFLVWLVGLVFAGLGLLPSSELPFGRAFVGQSPPTLKALPPITQPAFARRSAAGGAAAAAGANSVASTAASGLRGSASTGSIRAGNSGKRNATGTTSPVHGRGHGNGSAGPSAGTPATVNPVAPYSPSNGVHAGGSTPGRTVSQSSPGHTKSSGTSSAGGSGSSGSSGSSSGHGHGTTTSTTTTTTPGKSGSAPGHAAVR